jgi:hypothetical protein
MKTAPIVSERALRVLLPLLEGAAQVLPFHSLRNKPYYAINVLAVQHGLLDLERSELLRLDDENERIVIVHRTVFRKPLPPKLPAIFKLEESLSEIYVTETFARVVADNQLTGIRFLSPEQDTFQLLFGKEPLDAFPGTAAFDT